MIGEENISAEIRSLIIGYKNQFGKTGTPIQVNFRNIVPELTRGERYTHLIHSYPAKLICHIPYFFLSTDYYCPFSGKVLDPFCGSGTVLLEALISGRQSYGADANPIARKISKVKTTFISPTILFKELNQIIYEAKNTNINPIVFTPENLFWYPKDTIASLSQIVTAIQNIKDENIKNFFEICVSSILKKVSFADPRISVPVRVNADKFAQGSKLYNNAVSHINAVANIDIFDSFHNMCISNIERIGTLANLKYFDTHICSDDARRLTANIETDTLLEDESIDLIITSPPYAGAQKYIRASSLNLRWLNIADKNGIKELKAKNIGREDYKKSEISVPKTGIKTADTLLKTLSLEGNQERAHIVANYLLEMEHAIDECIRVLKRGGYFIMVIGNNTVCGHEFDTQAYLTEYMIAQGLSLEYKLIDDIKSYGLMTKRNKTASRISCEWILVLKK